MITEARHPSIEERRVNNKLILDFSKIIHSTTDDYHEFVSWIKKTNDRFKQIDHTFRAMALGSVINKVFILNVVCSNTTYKSLVKAIESQRISIKYETESSADLSKKIVEIVNEMVNRMGLNDFGYR